MPRPNVGPRLQLKKPRGYKRKLFFVVWYESGKRIERATNTDDRRQAESTLEKILASRSHDKPQRMNRKEMSIRETLGTYAEYINNRALASDVRAPARVAHGIEALMGFWSDKNVSNINAATIAEYRAFRSQQPTRAQIAGAKSRGEQIRTVSTGTVDREIGILRTAINHCAEIGKLTAVPVIKLKRKKKPDPDNYYSRKEVAALLRAARKERMTSWQLCLFILIAVYSGARSEAILSLRWRISPEGGWVDLERNMINYLPEGQDQSTKRKAHSVIPPRLRPFLVLAWQKRTSDFVFEHNGKQLTCNAKAFKRAQNAAGFEIRKRNRHTLRDTCVTWLLDAGMAAWHVSKFVDMTIEMIQSIYGKKTPTLTAEHMRKKLQLDRWQQQIPNF